MIFEILSFGRRIILALCNKQSMGSKFNPQTKKKFLELFLKMESTALGRTGLLTTGWNQRRMATFSTVMLVEDQHAHGQDSDKSTPFNPVSLCFPKSAFILSILRKEGCCQ